MAVMINYQEIYKWWDVIKHGKELTEIRILDGQRTYSGYFKDIDILVKALEPYNNLPHAQIYFTLNHIKEACFSRSQQNKMILVKREPTTGDLDIDGRTHVLIDLDPQRPAGVGSSDEELNYAYLKAIDIYNYLMAQGFYEPIVSRSGNGYHVTIPCLIGVEDEKTEIIKRFLKVLSLMFSDEHVEVDEKVFNLSRICKLPGTMAMKGENSVDRPWRMSQIVKIPANIQTTDIAYFKKIADLFPDEDVKPNRWNNYSTERFDLVLFLNKHGIGYKEERVAGGTKYVLDHCPFNEQHKHKDAVIFQRDTGAIGFLCFHNSCSGKTWRDVRTLFEPDAYDRHYQTTPQVIKTPTQPVVVPIVQTGDKGKVWISLSEVKKPQIDLNDYICSGIPFIDEKGLGFRRGHVSVWTGFRACGKSSLLNSLILNAAQKGFKNALWTGELTVDMEKQWLYLQAAGKQYNKKYNNTDYYFTPSNICEKIDKWIDKYLWVFNNKYGDNFLQIKEQVVKLKAEQDIDQLFLDNLMVLGIKELEQDKYERQAALLQDLEDFAKELNIHIHLVAHPHKAFGYLRIDNISGSGDIGNKADNVFILSRVNRDFLTKAPEFIEKYKFQEIKDSHCTNVIEIAKFRNRGTLQDNFVKLWFEHESNRLKSDITESIIYKWSDDVATEEHLPFGNSIEGDAPF